MGKLRRGQRLTGIPANDWNRFHDAADAVLGRGIGTELLNVNFGGGNLVYVKNNSGADVDRFRALGIDGVNVEPSDDLAEFQTGVVLQGAKPSAASHYGKWCITQELIEDGEIGVAAIAGLTPVEVDVPGTVYPWPYVEISNGSFLPTESWFGAAEILAGPWTDNSKRWALVRLANFVSPTVKAIVTATITAGGTGSAQIQIGGSAQETISGVQFDWMDNDAAANDIAVDREILMRFYRDDNAWIVEEAECGDSNLLWPQQMWDDSITWDDDKLFNE